MMCVCWLLEGGNEDGGGVCVGTSAGCWNGGNEDGGGACVGTSVGC